MLKNSHAQKTYTATFYYSFNQKEPKNKSVEDIRSFFEQATNSAVEKITFTASSDTIGTEKGNILIGELRFLFIRQVMESVWDSLPKIEFTNEGSKLQKKRNLSNEQARFLKVEMVTEATQITPPKVIDSVVLDKHLVEFVAPEEKTVPLRDTVKNYRGTNMILSISFWGDKNKYLGNPVPALTQIHTIYMAQPDLQLHISGHSCCENKVFLSKRRAKRVYRDLRKMGIPKSNISHQGYGNKRPAVEEINDVTRQKNRRVEVAFD